MSAATLRQFIKAFISWRRLYEYLHQTIYQPVTSSPSSLWSSSPSSLPPIPCRPPWPTVNPSFHLPLTPPVHPPSLPNTHPGLVLRYVMAKPPPHPRCIPRLARRPSSVRFTLRSIALSSVTRRGQRQAAWSGFWQTAAHALFATATMCLALLTALLVRQVFLEVFHVAEYLLHGDGS